MLYNSFIISYNVTYVECYIVGVTDRVFLIKPISFLPSHFSYKKSICDAHVYLMICSYKWEKCEKEKKKKKKNQTPLT